LASAGSLPGSFATALRESTGRTVLPNVTDADAQRDGPECPRQRLCLHRVEVGRPS
jgi:hypothetical protein